RAGVAMTAVDCGDVLEGTAEAVSMVEAARGRRYAVDVTPPDLVLEADRERLHQVVTNLLQNAIRHSPPGGEIRLEAYPVDDDVVLEIVDEGPGIAKEDRERIFERFARASATGAHTTTGGSAGGTGIGLAIVRLAAALQGGRIEVADSRSGAPMRVTLPARPRAFGAPPDGALADDGSAHDGYADDGYAADGFADGPGTSTSDGPAGDDRDDP